MAELQRAYFSLPPVTRTLLSLTAATTLPTLLAVVSPYSILFHLPSITRKHELWRLVTPFFYAGSGLGALFNVFFLFRTSNDLETGYYQGRPHDLAWALTWICGGIAALNYPLGSVIFFRALLLALTHLWAQFSPETPMNLYGFITIPAKYLSFAFLGMDLLQAGPYGAMQGLTGIISAHVFYYLKEVYPRANPGGARRICDTPAWFARLFGASGRERVTRNTAGGTGFAPRTTGSASTAGPRTSTTGARGYQWGSGNRLGEN